MEEKTTIPLTDGEWNIIIHALFHKTEDRNNTPQAKQQYLETYRKLMNIKYGERSAII